MLTAKMMAHCLILEMMTQMVLHLYFHVSCATEVFASQAIWIKVSKS